MTSSAVPRSAAQPAKALLMPCGVPGISRRFRIRSNIGAESRFPDRPGKTSSFVCGISLRMVAAWSDSGTRKATPAFMRAPGRFRSRASKSTSLQRSPRISPDRIPVNMSSRNAVWLSLCLHQAVLRGRGSRRVARPHGGLSRCAACQVASLPRAQDCHHRAGAARVRGPGSASGDRGYALLSQAWCARSAPAPLRCRRR